MNYWLDLFTGTTWDEFRQSGANVSGFRHRMRNAVAKIQPGDILLCYMTGVMRWVGALRVIGPSDDQRVIWKDCDFPVRVFVKPFVMLDAEFGVPMETLEGQVRFYRGPQDKGKYRGVVRRSPFKLDTKDGELLVRLMDEAKKSGERRPVDPKKLARKPLFKVRRKKGRKDVESIVSVPEKDEADATAEPGSAIAEVAAEATLHTEMQYRLLRLGASMGFDVWVAKNDRAKVYGTETLGAMARMIDELPTQFNEATNKTIELIDVLWLKGNSIVAAFEVESTTAVYSGLLRMSDLLALQPNLNIDLYIVAPEDRRDKVEREILRPTFNLREPPLAKVCGFLSINDLLQKIDGIEKLGLLRSVKADFLKDAAEYFGA
jgi:hypothetical protein